MPTYSYKGYTSDGKRREGFVEADGRKSALRKLAQQGVFADELSPLASGAAPLAANRRAMLYRELSVLLNAGLTLENALQMLMGEPDKATSPLWLSLAPMRDAVREGQSVASALAGAAPGASDYEKAVLVAAERTASLPSVLARLADTLDSRREAAERIRSAALYPSFVLFLGVAVAFLLLGVLVPRAQASLAAGGIALPPASMAVVRIARVIAWGSAIGVAALAAGLAAVLRLRRANHNWRTLTDRRLINAPLAGKMLERLAASRFASTLAVLCGAGVPLVEAMPLAGTATGNSWIEREVQRESENVRHGKNLESSIRSIPHLSRHLAEWIRVGEAGGCLDEMLEVAAGRAQAQWERSMSRALTLFEPAVLLAVGLFVLAVALAVLLPVTSITRSII